MPGWLKVGLLAVVIGAILYVLISPLPELDGTVRSFSSFFAFVARWALLSAFVSSFFLARASLPLSSSVEDILKMNCARLC